MAGAWLPIRAPLLPSGDAQFDDRHVAAVRQGDWKLVWRTTLPSLVELYNIPQDPSEKNNLARQHPEAVAALQKRAAELAAEATKPMLLELGFKALLEQFHLPPAFPGEEFEFTQER